MLVLVSAAFGANEPNDAMGDATWRLDHIYPTIDAFEAARVSTSDAIGQLVGCKGKLGSDASTFLRCLDQKSAVEIELGRLQSYASNHSNVDKRVEEWQQRDAAVNLLITDYYAATSWVAPEIVALGREKIDRFMEQEPKLQPYRYPLDATLRHGEHVLSPQEEQILALASGITERPGETYVTFVNANLPWPTYSYEGEEVRLQQATFARLRSDKSPQVRREVFDTFFGALQSYEGTLGQLLGAQVASHWFVAQARHYSSSVEAALDDNFVPRVVYDTLVRETNANLPTLHRYLKLRAEMLDLDKLAYSDMYVPLVQRETSFSLAESQRIAAASAKPLGAAYVAAMEEGFRSGWVDAYPKEGKLPGAYMSSGAYGTHPFVLLNHNNDYESASTFAHEFGHAMHSYLATRAQPFQTADYSIFLAEVASTFNEALLLDYMLKNAKSDDEKLFYLGSALENLRKTYYRQAMFAEFELAIHEKVEQGEPLTGSVLTALYGDLLRRYYGADQGLIEIKAPWTIEWAYIPHFYYNFYVYQYSTSIAASALLAQDVLDKKKGAVDRYLKLLSAGGSDDPYVLLKEAGVDLGTAEPYRALAQRMNRIMDQIEAIRAKRRK